MTKIDDEHIERAATMFCRIMDRPAQHECKAVCNYCLSSAQAILEAALSPKPEPEIEVSEGMLKAGFSELKYRRCINCTEGYETSEYQRQILIQAYRAMESTRLKEAQEWASKDGHVQGDAAYAAKSAPQGVNAAAPVKETGGGVLGTLHARKGEKKAHQHRRKDDATYVSFFSLDRA